MVYVPIPTVSRYVPVAEETFPELRHPSCAGSVTIVAYQLHTETRLASRVTSRTTGAAYCAASGEWIPVLGWTGEMERAFRDLARRAPLAPTSRTFTRRFYGLIAFMAVVVALAAAAIAWVWSAYGGDENDYTRAAARVEVVAAEPAPGDRVAVTTPGSGDAFQMQWYVVRDTTGGAVELQAYDTLEEGAYALPDLDPDRFTGATVTVDGEAFLAGSMLGTGGAELVLNAFPADD